MGGSPHPGAGIRHDDGGGPVCAVMRPNSAPAHRQDRSHSRWPCRARMPWPWSPVTGEASEGAVKQYPADHIRNVGLFSHGGAGKTSLTEALLFDTKAVTRLGRVEDGNTVADFDPDEIKRHISVNAAVAPVEWRDTKINLVDAPGYADFMGDVVSALRVVDAALILMDASAGVEVGTEQAWRLADRQGIARMIFVNKMDRENANFADALDSARRAF